MRLTTSDFVVRTEGLVRDYRGGAGLHGVDLAVPRNEVYGLVGRNGAGKTTLLLIVAGLKRFDSGTVTVDAKPDCMAVCPDTPGFEPWLTAREVIRQSRGLAVNQRSGEREVEPVGAVLEQVGLADAADRRVGGFSRGMKQRLSLAAALALDPELIILDEPTGALDPAGRVELLTLVAALSDVRTVVFSSHILSDVQRVADSVGVLDHGRLIFQGPTRTLIDSYLRPAWNVRVRGGSPAALAERLRAVSWVTEVKLRADESLQVEAISAEAGEHELPHAVVDAGMGLVSLNPVDADLEAAFLALTQGTAGGSDE